MNVLITGGAGFIGCNTARYFLKKNNQITILDNLSRKGSDYNYELLKKDWPSMKFENIDIRNNEKLFDFLKNNTFDVILHFAAQVAVTTSVEDPKTDFEINAIGTFNLLEAIRNTDNINATVIYTSTNKVYGEMLEYNITEYKKRYDFSELTKGIDENINLDFHSPYGCSKGIADQYMIDYSRIYGLNTVVFRQSCIYGYYQFGVEDQGWLAWFIIALMSGKPITLYGDGKQVRDVLFIEDLVRLYDLAVQKISNVKGQAFNIGGGPANSLSLLEFFDILKPYFDKKIEYSFSDWRAGDQKVCIMNTDKAYQLLGWQPEISYKNGIEKLFQWITSNKEIIMNILK